MTDEDQFGRSWSMDKRLLAQRVPVMQDFAAVVIGHYRREVGGLGALTADNTTALLDRICGQAVMVFDDAWEHSSRQSRLQQGRVRRHADNGGESDGGPESTGVGEAVLDPAG